MSNDNGAMLHPELLSHDDRDAIYRGGRRLDHAEGASKPLRAQTEKQPRGAKVHGNRTIDQAEAAARFIAAPEHEKMHDERLWDLRQKRDREMHVIFEWEELRALASSIKEHTLVHLDVGTVRSQSAGEWHPCVLGQECCRTQPHHPPDPQ
jgi:L-lactate dehydrogenase complex protein LldF